MNTDRSVNSTEITRYTVDHPKILSLIEILEFAKRTKVTYTPDDPLKMSLEYVDALKIGINAVIDELKNITE